MSDRYIITDAQGVIDKMRSEIPNYVFNPSLVMQRKMELLEAATFGEIDIVDATSPFMHLATAGAIFGSGILAEMEVINRRIYPYSAQRIQEILPHMSDKDFGDLFAMPDGATFVLIFSKQELIDNMVNVGDTGIRKLVIPRNTRIKALETYYSLEYPIEIRQMNHDGIQVVWDMDKPAPFASIESNQIEHFIVRDPDTKTELLLFYIPLKQFFTRTLYETINEATETTISATFEDQFCLARVYFEREANVWEEINVTYTDRVYPANRPTAIIQVVDNICTAQIPQIYINAGLLAPGRRVRLDIYQTKGPLNQSLGSYDRTNYTIEWYAIDPADKNIYQSALPILQTALAFSEETSFGGRQPLPFETIRERMTTNAIGDPSLPITPVQARSVLVTSGYSVIQRMDTLTKRTYLATRAMPRPEASELITAANGGIHTLISSFGALVKNTGVIDNGKSITLTPDVLYRITGNSTMVVDNTELATLLALPRDKLAQAISNGNYFYSPFHYVLDNSNFALDCRAYYLDQPSVTLRSFVEENDTTLLQVGIKSVTVARIDGGFKVQIQTSSSKDWKELPDENLFVQLAFSPDSSGKLTYLNGVQTGLTTDGERIYDFFLGSSFNVDSEDRLELTTFQMITQSEQLHMAPLETMFSVLFGTTSVMPTGHRINEVDSALGFHLLDEGAYGINHERIRIRFGKALDNLWSKCRTSVDGNKYETYDVDVPKLYEQDVYERDPVTGSELKVVNGQVVRTKLHSRGDVMTENGTTVYAYRKGDVKMVNNEPVIAKNRDTLHIVDLFLIESVYRFADSSTSVAYRGEIVSKIVNWITRDLASIQKRTLEETEVFFYPVHSTGAINVMYGEGLRTTIDANQSFVIRLFINDQIYRNSDVRAELERKTVETLEKELSKKTVSVSNITKALESVYGEDVISFEVPRLAGAAQLSLVTVLDEGRSLSLRKVLQLRSDDVLAVKEDVTVEFRRHSL